MFSAELLQSVRIDAIKQQLWQNVGTNSEGIIQPAILYLNEI